MVYQVYKTTNLLNNMIYVGVHKHPSKRGEYFGSGKLLLLAVKKYGKDNFKKEILFEFKTSNEAYKKEAEIVNHKFISSPMTYNIQIGGTGGWDVYGSGNKGKVIVKDSSGERFLISKTDPKYLSGELIAWNKDNRQTVESNKKRSQALIGYQYPKIECPYCHKMISTSTLNKHNKGRFCKIHRTLTESIN